MTDPDGLEVKLLMRPDGTAEAVTLFRGMAVRDMIGYPIGLAARVAGCSYHTLWREIKLKKLVANGRGWIAREELERWLFGRSLRKPA
ncbi:MAG TPA: hypothetical protein VNU68_21810 [Verrucomicrobiae bacterium]|nr:hypothetical protein [Verrucomicrobiae bacterium]